MATYITTKAAAKLLNMTTQSIYLIKKKTRVKWIKMGNQILYEKQSLLRYKKYRWHRKFILNAGEWTIRDTANYFGCPSQRIYHMIRCNNIPFEKRGSLFILNSRIMKKIAKEEPWIFKNKYKRVKHHDLCDSDENTVGSEYA